MKKIILLALTALIMVGCLNKEDAIAYVEKGDFATIEYDSCEYLIRVSGYLAHKGNCRFCAERRQEELETFVKQIKEK